MTVGIGVSAGVGIGPVLRVPDPVRPPADEPPAADVESTAQVVASALESVAVELERRAELAGAAAGEMLHAAATMARDRSLLAGVVRRLGEGSGPARALDDAVEEVCVDLETAGEVIAQRATDLRDIRDRAIAHLVGAPQPGIPGIDRPSVLVARDLAPADTAGLSATSVLGLVTEAGGPTSHAAILAAQLGIPAVVGVGRLGVPDGTVVALDGTSGEVVVAPSEDLCATWIRRAAERADWLSRFGGPGRTRDGVPVALLANIGMPDDAQASAAEDVEGVGLFRTEFLYLGRPTPPSVDEQTDAYLGVLRAFGPRRVVVRTLDAGADKPLPFLRASSRQANPALGVRGLRLGRQVEALLTDQLTALAAASRQCTADVWVMAPMVATAEEARWFASRARAAGIGKVGVMIEIPAAALRAGQLLAEVDFASIGTNDLAQYAMAVDRTLGELAALHDPWQPALLDLVAAAVAGGVESKPIGACGEAAGDPLLSLVLVGLGVSSLSMVPAKVPAVRTALAMHDQSRCVEMAAAARAAATPQAARAAVVELLDPEARALV